MKSFRLYRGPSASVPTQLASDLSFEEQMRLQQAFRPAVARYRLHKQVAFFALLGFAGCISAFMFLGGVLHVRWVSWCFLPAVVCWLAGAAAMVTAPKLLCPSCRNDLEYRFGPYCPECGEAALRRGAWFRGTDCVSCGKTLRFGKGRRYKIRACTYCGLLLDGEGL